MLFKKHMWNYVELCGIVWNKNDSRKEVPVTVWSSLDEHLLSWNVRPLESWVQLAFQTKSSPNQSLIARIYVLKLCSHYKPRRKSNDRPLLQTTEQALVAQNKFVKQEVRKVHAQMQESPPNQPHVKTKYAHMIWHFPRHDMTLPSGRSDSPRSVSGSSGSWSMPLAPARSGVHAWAHVELCGIMWNKT